MAKLFLDICLSDIPEKLVKHASNGKDYVKLTIGEMKQTDERGNDHYVSVWVPKENQGPGFKTTYIGRGKLNKPKDDGIGF